MTVPVEIDARGLRCPLPVLRVRKALAALPPGADDHQIHLIRRGP